MKREFLVGLGLEDEVVDKIVAEHGRSLQAVKDKNTNLEADLKTANDTISELQKENADNADLQDRIKDYEQQLADVNSQRATDRKNAFVELGLTKAGVRNSKAVTALLDLEKVVEDGDSFNGLDEQLKALKESDSYLFEVEDKAEDKPKFAQEGNPAVDNSGNLSEEDKALFAGFDSI